MAQTTAHMTAKRSARTDRARVLAVGAVLVAVICALPMLAVLIAALTGGTDTVQHLVSTVLGAYTWTTLKLVVLVAAGTFAMGVGAAWLVVTGAMAAI